MKIDPIDLKPSPDIIALADKRVGFNLALDDSDQAADGVGTLIVSSSGEKDTYHIYISVDKWPEGGGPGTATFYRFYLNYDELSYLRSAPNDADYEIECYDPRLKGSF